MEVEITNISSITYNTKKLLCEPWIVFALILAYYSGSITLYNTVVQYTNIRFSKDCKNKCYITLSLRKIYVVYKTSQQEYE